MKTLRLAAVMLAVLGFAGAPAIGFAQTDLPKTPEAPGSMQHEKGTTMKKSHKKKTASSKGTKKVSNPNQPAATTDQPQH